MKKDYISYCYLILKKNCDQKVKRKRKNQYQSVDNLFISYPELPKFIEIESH